MIHYVNKDITTVSVGVIAHGVNCQGVMGSGVALAIRNKWPEVYERYLSQHLVQIGSMLGLCDAVTIDEGLIVANCYTQEYFGYGGKFASPDAIAHSLEQALYICADADLPLYLPRIGCARGGLVWHEDVAHRLMDLSENFPDVEIYVCDFVPADETVQVR